MTLKFGIFWEYFILYLAVKIFEIGRDLTEKLPLVNDQF